jgi:exonuclease III
MIEIIHWNINWFKSKKDLFEIYIKNRKTLPHIISLNETKIDKNFEFSFKDFFILRKDCTSRSGGLIIFIHNSLKYEPIQEINQFKFPEQTAEALAAKIFFKNTYFAFINLVVLRKNSLHTISVCKLKFIKINTIFSWLQLKIEFI